jgi:arylsulfatase A-like enzyme
MTGLFAASGPDISSIGRLPAAVSILDFAPTVLHCLGLPVPRDMDGCVLLDIFDGNSEPATRPIKYAEPSGPEKVKRRIRSLRESGRI